MLKGLAITPPVVGRISIGRVIERNGKRLPGKDDQFTLTTQIQNHDGWMLHPLDETMRKTSNGKLRTIPIRLMFNDPHLNLRAEYSAFEKETGRPICVGNGDTCRRAVNSAIETLPCPSPEACEFGLKRCKPYGRLNVLVGEDDELGSFIFRTTSFNSIRTLAARLNYYHALSGGLLATMPLELKLRGKSTTQSYRSAIYYVDLVVRSGMSLESAIAQARELAERKKVAGFDQTALDAAARMGLANGAFEDSADEAPGVVEEFYPTSPASAGPDTSMAPPDKPSLNDKLKAKTDKLIN